MKCYSCVCLKGEFPKCRGKNMNIFVYEYVVFLFKTNKCFVMFFVIVNMAIAISTRDLYDKCKDAYLKKQLPENEILSFSWFEFQF